jgi:hypothetical protein
MLLDSHFRTIDFNPWFHVSFHPQYYYEEIIVRVAVQASLAVLTEYGEDE